MDFSEWITRKYIEWRGEKLGNAASLAAFAETFGASHQVMSLWMKKGSKGPRDWKYISALAETYGEEVYDVLGLPRPDFTSRIRGAVREALTVMTSNGIDPDTPEGEKIIAEIAAKYGFEAKRTSDE